MAATAQTAVALDFEMCWRAANSMNGRLIVCELSGNAQRVRASRARNSQTQPGNLKDPDCLRSLRAGLQKRVEPARTRVAFVPLLTEHSCDLTI